jgi:hypothetical protein
MTTSHEFATFFATFIVGILIGGGVTLLFWEYSDLLMEKMYSKVVMDLEQKHKQELEEVKYVQGYDAGVGSKTED